jgi:NitT/TauT family transport system permease protein
MLARSNLAADLARRRKPRVEGLMTFMGTVGPSVFGLVAFFALWEFAIRLTHTPAFIAPTPTATLGRLVSQFPQLAHELAFTLFTAGAGLLIGLVVGIGGAVLMAQWRILERSLFPLAVMVKITPMVAIAPLLIVWLGYTLLPIIIIAALITFFPVLVNCITGLRAVDPLALEFFRSVGASRREILFRLRLPSSLPYLFAALKIAINLSLIGAIVGEFFGSENGIGRVISQSALQIDMPTMFAAVFLLGITGVTLTVLTNLSERRVLYWHESARLS